MIIHPNLGHSGQPRVPLSPDDYSNNRAPSEEELRARAKQLEAAQMLAQLGSWEWDVARNRVDWSDQLYRIFGLSREDFVATFEGYLARVHPEDRDRTRATIEQSLREQKPFCSEERIVRLDGVVRFLQSQGDVVVDSHGQLQRMTGICQDITERKRTEAILRASEKRYASLVDNLDGIVWEIDAESLQFRFVSRQAERILGYPVSRWLADSDFWSSHIHEADRDWAVEYCLECKRRGVDHDFEYRMIAADGREVWIHDLVTVEVVDGQAVTLRGVMVDITARKRAEEERRQLELRILQAQKLESLGVLAGGIAHDFNNLLTSMMGYASLAQMQLPPDSGIRPMLEEIEKAALRAAELTQQMLAYSGKGKFVIQVMDLESVVREMAKLLQTVISKKAALRLDLGAARIEGDATQLRQIVMNLITNASDSLGAAGGAVVVRTGTRHADAEMLRSPYFHEVLPEGTYAFVEVEDGGSGMDAETLARIFDPFFTTKFTGRGLGLAAVLGIVRGHRGTIHVSSTVGIGTQFQVLIPAYSGRPSEARPSPTKPWRGRGTILLVEDESLIRLFTRRVLEGAGFEVMPAYDGQEGLELYERHRGQIVAVVLDWTTPRLEGTQVVRELRARRVDVPILVMSGYSEHEVATHLDCANASAFLQKPFQPSELIGCVRKILGE